MEAAVVHSARVRTWPVLVSLQKKASLSLFSIARKLIKEHPKVCKFYETITNKPAFPNCICCNDQGCPVTVSKNIEQPVHQIEDNLCFDSLLHEELSEIEKCCQQLLPNDSQDESPTE